MLAKRWATLCLALIVVACGGGEGKNPATEDKQSFTFRDYKEKGVYLSSDLESAKEHWITLSLQPTYDLTPEQSINIQASVPGRLILFADQGKNKLAPYDDFFNYVDLAAANPRFEYVYVYDELFWDGAKDTIGWREDDVANASNYARSKGIKAIVDILPYTILNPDFKLKNYNAFDVIAINLYPSMMVNKETHGCKYNNNLYTNILYCSQKKLRDSGFRGEVWYVYQAFGLTSDSPQELESNFKLQQETIKIAPSFDISTVLPFGLYLGKEELNAEPYLIPGKGSSFEALVNPR